MPSVNGPTIIRGEPVTEEELSLFKDLRAVYLPLARFKATDDFAKWLFSLSTIIGSLGAALSNSAAFKLEGLGRTLFAIAVALTGVSFALATVSLVIDVGAANPNAPDAMADKLARHLSKKRALLVSAVLSLMVALILAGMAPALSKPAWQPNAISYVLNGSSLDVVYLAPATPGRDVLRVNGSTGGPTSLLAEASRISDPIQQTKLEITKISIPENVQKVVISASAGSNQEIPVEIPMPKAATMANQWAAKENKRAPGHK